MRTNRMEAFSDGVLAIIITIMVLKLHTPAGVEFDDLRGILPTLIAYVLSYAYVGIYWINHHQIFGLIRYASGRLLWENLLWLFWMSFIPITTEWIGLHPFEPVPTFFYGLILFFCAVSYYRLQHQILLKRQERVILLKKFRREIKAKSSIFFYAAAMLLSLWHPGLAYVIYGIIAIYWIIPDFKPEHLGPDGEGGCFDDFEG